MTDHQIKQGGIWGKAFVQSSTTFNSYYGTICILACTVRIRQCQNEEMQATIGCHT